MSTKSVPVRFTLSRCGAAVLASSLMGEPGADEVKTGADNNISRLKLDIHDAAFVTAIIELTLFTGRVAYEIYEILRDRKTTRIDVRLANGKHVGIEASGDVSEESVKAALEQLLK
jgi:hypothetical protein